MTGCYILFSENLNRHYIGVCQESLQSRIDKHNSHEYGKHRFTAKSDDWELYIYIECESYSQALKIEKHLKKMKSTNYIKNLVLYPEIVKKLKEKYLKSN